MKSRKTSSAALALILILCALAGAGVSYHFTLEARFAAIEQKLDENSLSLEHDQTAQEETLSARNEALNKLSRQVDALESSLGPLGRATHDQTDALAAIRGQISTLQKSQQNEESAQKKITDYGAQLDTIRHEVELARVTTTPAAAMVSTRATAATAPAAMPVAPPVADTPPATVETSAAPPVPAPLPAEPAVIPAATPVSPAPHLSLHDKSAAQLRTDDQLMDNPGAVGLARLSATDRYSTAP